MTKRNGFTIVELLIVIVVIGILAAITIVAYNGIQAKATVASLQSDLENSNKQLVAYLTTSSTGYPIAIDCSASPAANTICLKSSGVTTYQYSVDNTSLTNPNYCITATSGTKSYYISNTVGVPTNGGCPGHSVGGVATIQNLATDPSVTSIAPFSAAGAGGVSTLQSTGGNFGPTFIRRTFNATGTSGIYWGTTAYRPQVTPGMPYTGSGYVRTSGVTASLRATLEWKDASSNIIAGSTVAGATMSVGSSWVRVSVTGIAPAGAVSADVPFYSISAWNSGDYEDVDNIMFTAGSTLYNYADPIANPSSWVWDNGNANNSTSTGPPL